MSDREIILLSQISSMKPTFLSYFLTVILMTAFSTVNAQYLVDFEGSGETKGAYASGTVSLSGKNWDMTEALIGTSGSDWFNGVRSARMRGYSTSSMTMLEDKAGGLGTISFQHQRYGTDSQQPYNVDYSTNSGSSWTNIGSFTSGASVATFSQAVNVTGNVRVRIVCTGTGSSNKRTNIDDINLTDYAGATPTLNVLPINLTGFTTTSGTASASQSYVLSGSNLAPSSGNITVTAPTDFEVSLNNSTFSGFVNVSYTSGAIAGTTIYVRIKSSASAGNPSGNVTNAGGGATTQSVGVDGTVCPNTNFFSVGDISFVGYGTDDPDQFSFVTWVSIPNGREIIFTDNAWTGSALNSNEGDITWQNNTGSAIAPGTVIVFDLGTGFDLGTTSSTSGSFALSTSQDNLFAYEGSSTCPSFIYGISNNSWITTGTPNTNNSYLPAQLNVANGNMQLPATDDNWEFSSSRNNQSSIAAYKPIVNNSSNWTGNNTIFTLSSTDFTLASSTPSVELSASAGSGSEAAGSTITITATASAAVTGNQTVTISVSGSGITGTDYSLSSSGIITILNGQTTGSITFTILDDSDVEGAETASLTYLPFGLSSGLIAGTSTSVDINIADNDGSVLYSQSSGGTNDPIWDIFPNGTGQPATNFGGFSEFMDVVVQAGHVVDITVSGLDMKSLTVQIGGKVYANNGASPEYIDIFGNVTNNGTIGNGTTLDLISFNFKGTNPITFSGNGSYDLGRLRKDAGATGTVNLNSNINLRFAGAALYNNNSNSSVDVTIGAGKTVSVLDPAGDVSIDGTAGAGASENGGSITVNGTLNVANKLYAISNNSTIPCSITIGSTGKIIAKNVDINIGTGFNAFNINSGGKLEINNLLAVLGGTLNSNGGVIINSGATLLHGAGTSGGGGSVTGNVTVKRQGTTINDVFNFWSSPVQTGTVPGNSAFSYDSNLGTQDYSDDTTPADPGWQTFWGYMTPGQGYASRGGGLASFIGVPNNGSIPYALTYYPYSPGNTDPGTPFNLVGNPYPGAISASAFVAANSNINGSLYFWDDDLSGGSGYSYTDYAVWNGTGSIGTGAGTTPPNGFIASGQGFEVRALNAGNITFTNSMRASGSNNLFFRESNEESRLWLSISSPDGPYNEILLGMIEDATDGEDRLYDAVKLHGQHVLSLAAMEGSDEYSIMAFPPPFSEKVVPLELLTADAGQFTFNAHTMTGFDGYTVYLEDRRTSTWTHLSEGTEVNVSLSEGEHHGRFYLHFEVASATGIDDTVERSLQVMYGSTGISVALNSGNASGLLEVIGVDGKQVYAAGNVTLGQSPETIPTNGLASGIYLLRFSTEEGVFITRIFNN